MIDATRNQRDFDILNYGMTPLTNGSWVSQYGTIKWYNEEGHTHKEDGPAVTHKTGEIYWFINGTYCDFIDYLKLSPIPDEQKLLLRLQYE
jgi:hypothetical protein